MTTTRPTAERRVLIAHQSAIPHYRVAFYRAVERLKPAHWSFAVVYDPDPARQQRVFVERPDASSFGFPLETTSTWSFKLGRKTIRFQPFLEQARGYDLLVLEDAFHNLAYPLARLMLGGGERIAYWGHGRDRSVANPRAWKVLTEKLKLRWTRTAAGYFAYTPGVRDFLVEHGVARDRVFVLNNTVDIALHRREHESLTGARAEIRRSFGGEDQRLLLYVGRLTWRKQLDYLVDAVAGLRTRDPRYKLLMVGAGDSGVLGALRERLGAEGFDYRGVLIEAHQLAPLFVAADAYVFPGDVGLGPLTALCYDLTPVITDRPTHNPEVEYLDASNSVMAPAGSGPDGYGRVISDLLDDRERWLRLRAAAWPSIAHLTIDEMARNFIRGIDRILEQLEPTASASMRRNDPATGSS